MLPGHGGDQKKKNTTMKLEIYLFIYFFLFFVLGLVGGTKKEAEHPSETWDTHICYSVSWQSKTRVTRQTFLRGQDDGAYWKRLHSAIDLKLCNDF